MKRVRKLIAAATVVVLGGLAAPGPAGADVEAIHIDDTARSDYYSVLLKGTVTCSDDQAGYRLRVRAFLVDTNGDLVEGIADNSTCTGSPQRFRVHVIDLPNAYDGFESGDATVVAETAAPGTREVSDTMEVTEEVTLLCGQGQC